MMKRFLVVCAMVLMSTTFAHAAATEETAMKFSEDLGKDVLAILDKDGASMKQKHAKLEKKFRQVVDVDWVAKFVMGRHFRSLDAAKQKEYMKAYERFVILNYTSNFVDYTSGTSFKVVRAREDKPGKFYVTTEIVRPGKQSVILDYRLRAKGNSFEIYDIIVEGVSLITAQRSEFDSVMAQENIDYLIKHLKQKADAAEAKVNAGA